MKKLLSLFLSAVMLVSALCFTDVAAYAANIKQIGLGVTTSVTVTDPSDENSLTAFAYMAQKSGYVYFYSTGDMDTFCAAAVDENVDNMIMEDDNYNEYNFLIEIYLSKGEFVIFVPNSYTPGEFNVTLTDKKPADYVRCTHDLVDIVNQSYASCTEDGYTGNIVCDECGKIVEMGKVIPKSSSIRRSFTEVVYNGKVQRPLITVYDREGKQLEYKKDFTVSYSNFNSKNVGTYKVTVKMIGNYNDTRTYTYKIVPQTNVTPKLNRNTFTMSNNVQRPLVTVTDKNGKQLEYKKDFKVDYSNWNSKAVGRYTVTVTMLGNYSGKKTYAYYINPKGTTFLTSAQGGFKGIKNGFTVKWNKQTNNTTGYQIQYATRSDFSNAATIYAGPSSANSKTVTGRAGNTRYYVRIRTYKNIGGKYFYSDWSTGSKSVVTLR